MQDELMMLVDQEPSRHEAKAGGRSRDEQARHLALLFAVMSGARPAAIGIRFSKSGQDKQGDPRLARTAHASRDSRRAARESSLPPLHRLRRMRSPGRAAE